MPKLILASSSSSRSAVLKETGVLFDTISPDIDESFNDKTPQEFVQRLSIEKAHQGWKNYKEKFNPEVSDEDFLVIGADQVALFDNKIYGKPKSIENAKQYLTLFSGKEVRYLSGLSIYRPKNNKQYTSISTTKALFKELSQSTISRYIELDKPLFCAGAIKIESMGTSLIQSYQCEDPTAITGLPLVLLGQILSKHELSLMSFSRAKSHVMAN